MAQLTTAQQSIVSYITVGALGIPPGGYMEVLSNVLVANGGSYGALVNGIVNSDVFQKTYPTYLSADQFASKYATALLGSTHAGLKTATDFMTAQLNAGVSRADLVANVLTFLYNAKSDATFGDAATKLANQADVGLYYTVSGKGTSTDTGTLSAVISSVTKDAASVTSAKAVVDSGSSVNTGNNQTLNLTTGQDSLSSSATTDQTFNARIFDNQNTLQSGDKIAGGTGTNDTLFADIGNSQKFAITAETTGIENVTIRGQAVSSDSTDNNLSATNEVQIDAERMVGVNKWESNNSRADVLVEDVRILPSQITKDITIAMVETDPGHVDFGVYFDQYSLRSKANNSSSLSIELADTRSLAAGGAALKDNPYWGFKFLVNGVEQTVTSDAIDAAQTYPELLAAVNAALAANSALAGITASLGTAVTRTDTISGTAVSVTPLVLTSSTGATLATTTNNAWLAKNGVPASSGLHTLMNTTSSTSTDKVTSKVILDDVGRGSTGGDLVIGGLSVGDTSTSLGVERFEIEVRDNSKLQTINSTNNTLQEVTIKNGATSSSSFAYVGTTKDSGNLTVNGNVATSRANVDIDGNVALPGTSTGNISGGSNIDAALPGTSAQHNGYGFSDVRLIDASAMTGKLAFTAEVTERSIAKYMNLVDTQANPVETTTQGSGVNGFGTGSIANFQYTGGANNDTMIVDLDSGVVGSRSKVVSGREDFTFKIDGGAGDDQITVVVKSNAANGAANWYNNQDLNNNITVLGGAGNDTIRTPGAGDVQIDAGTGNDTIYTDNTGYQTAAVTGAAGIANVGAAVTTQNVGYLNATSSNVKAVWVFNTVDQVTNFGTAPTTGNYGSSARNLGDLRSDTNESYNFYNTKVTVTFKGVPVTTATVAGSGYKTTDLQLNQAIKNAINNDAVLSKLLLAEDGPANSLVVKSLIDGTMNAADLGVSVATMTLNDVTALSATELAAVGVAYGVTNPTAASVFAAMTTAYNSFTTNGDYDATAMANDGAANIVGANSVTASDNLVAPGEGNDIVVLSTTVGTDVASSSNETVVYGTSFGNDTVVNFAANGVAIDHLDLTALKGVTLTTDYTTDKSITVVAQSSLGLSTTLTEKTAVETLFNANNAAAQDHVLISVDAHNVGYVYTVSDAIGATNAVATLQGSIDLATTAWASLTQANFVNSAAANYAQNEGPTTLNGSTGVVTPGTGTAQTIAVSAAGSVTETAATNTTFNVAAGNYTYNIAGFSAGDKLVFPTAGLATIVNSSLTDGVVDVQYATGGTTTIVHLTGIPTATDGAIFGVTSFNTAFGAGSLA